MKRTLRLLIAAGAAACIASSAAPAFADFPPYAHIVGVALVAPLSGDQRAYGIQLSNGMILALDESNEGRGLTDFGYVFHSFDDQNDPGVAQQQADFSLVDPQTAIVVGHVGAEETYLSLPVYHQKETPLIIPTSPIAQLTRTGYDNVFRLCPTDIVEGQSAARYAERTLKAKKAAVVYEAVDYGTDAGGGFLDYANGGKALQAKPFEVGIELKNVNAVVAAVKAYEPDLIYISGRAADMGIVLNALRAAGIEAQALGSQALYDGSATKAAGSAANQLIVSSCVPPIDFMPTAQVFLRHYQARFGRVTSFALMGYVAAQIAIDVTTQIHGSDKLAIIRQLSVGSFPTILGNYSFVRGGDVANPIVYFYQYSDGQFKYLTSSFPNPLIAR